jgi:hypothetical protein
MYHQTIFSFFTFTEGGGDSVLYNVVLEHQWRWITGDAEHRSLWSPPVFFPQSNTAAYTDLFLGVFPAYAAWRLIGVDPQTAFQLWMLAMSAFDYLAAYLMLRALLGTSAAGSAIGAAFFTIGSPRIAQIGHPQLLPGFFVVAVFAGFHVLLSQPPVAMTRRRLMTGLMLVLGGFAAQIYTAFYYAWFMAFSLALALVYALLVPVFRSRLGAFLRRHWLPAVISTLAAVALMAPAVLVYVGVLKQVGERPYAEVRQFLPSVTAWVAQGPTHWLYGPLNRSMGIGPDFGGREMFNGIGPVTTMLVLAGFIHFRNRPAVAVWGGICVMGLTLSLVWPGGFSLWHFVYSYFPAANAIRGVSRFGIFLLLPASIAVALGLDWIADRVSPLAAALGMLVVLVEQAGSSGLVPIYSRATVQAPAEAIIHRLRPDCKTFVASFTRGQTSVPWMHLFGMWAQLLSDIPTLNGYSGQVPPSWPIGDVAVGGPADRDRILAGIRNWMSRYPGQVENVCWVTPDDQAAMLIRGSGAGSAPDAAR